jgi:lipoprotein signal peptidase
MSLQAITLEPVKNYAHMFHTWTNKIRTISINQCLFIILIFWFALSHDVRKWMENFALAMIFAFSLKNTKIFFPQLDFLKSCRLEMITLGQ